MSVYTAPRSHDIPHIPDYLIYDEIKQRREQDRPQERLEMPLYRPQAPLESPSRTEDSDTHDEERRDRGVMIIDMNDLLDEDEDELG